MQQRFLLQQREKSYLLPTICQQQFIKSKSKKLKELALHVTHFSFLYIFQQFAHSYRSLAKNQEHFSALPHSVAVIATQVLTQLIAQSMQPPLPSLTPPQQAAPLNSKHLKPQSQLLRFKPLLPAQSDTLPTIPNNSSSCRHSYNPSVLPNLNKQAQGSAVLSPTFLSKLSGFCQETVQDCAEVAQKQLAVLKGLQCLGVNEVAGAVKQRNTLSRMKIIGQQSNCRLPKDTSTATQDLKNT